MNFFLNAHVTSRALLYVDIVFVDCDNITEELFREMKR